MWKSEWLYFKRVRDLPYEHPDYSLKYFARCIERRIRVDNVQRHGSEVQASLRSRGLVLPAGVIDDCGADAGVSTVPNEVGNFDHDPSDLLDDELYAVPGFTGKPMPKSPARKGQQRGSRLKSPRNSESPRERPQKPSTSRRESQGSKPNCAKKEPSTLQALGKWKRVGLVTSAKLVMIAALPDAVAGADAYPNPGKKDALIRIAGGLKSEQWGGEAEADGGLIMGVATLAMPATSAVRTWIIDTGSAQHLIGKFYLSRDGRNSVNLHGCTGLTDYSQ
eukprot:2561454-Amphidinium_carterae.1